MITQNSLGKVFICCFRKKQSKENLKEILGTGTIYNDLMAGKIKKKELNKLFHGPLRTIIGVFLGMDNHGRIEITALNVAGKYKKRVVDPRTLEMVILNGVRYVERGFNPKNAPEIEIARDDTEEAMKTSAVPLEMQRRLLKAGA